MRLCLMVEGQEGVTWDGWRALAGAVENHALEGLFRSDHYTSIVRPGLGSLDAWATLAALAAVTERIRLGTLVSPVTFRHPTVLARNAVTVDHVSGGRVEVGMGAGWLEREHEAGGFPFLDARRRFDLLAEHVEVVVRSWTEEGFDHRGPEYTLQGQTALPPPLQRPHPPLILGGTARPRSAALAARFASEYNTLGAPLPELRQRKARLDAACADAGRDRSSLVFSVMTACVIGVDRSDVLERLRRVQALLGDDRDPQALWEERGDRWLVGTVDDLAARLEELRALGVGRVFLQHLDHGDLDAVALLGDRLLPLVG